MAATNFTPIILYHTTTASAAPTAGNLNNGELAINITDGKLFYKDNGGTVQVIATKGTGTIGGSNTQVQYNSSGALAGSANFTFNGTTATINTLNLTNALGTAYGGTALTTYTQGDLVYASAANTLAKLGIGANTYILTSTGSVPQWSAPSAVTVATATNLAGGAAGSVPYQSGASTTTFLSIGSAGQVLTSSGSAPQWSNLSSLGVTSLSFGTTGLTPSTATQGAITVAGTLATTNGGTGLTSFTANGVFYASSTSAVGQSANLTFDGTTLVASNLTDSSLTTGRVVYTTTGGNLTDSANLLYSGTDLTVYGITVGRGAGAVSTNTAVGASALAANVNGYGNDAFGYNALLSTTNGYSNAGIGRETLRSNTTGANNVAFGREALYSNTTASNNTAVGYQAGYSNTTGTNLLAVGYQAGYSTTGGYVLAIGYRAGYSTAGNNDLCAIGDRALTSNTSGAYNVGVGTQALQANTTANYNTALGTQALYSNTTASNNTAVGYQAGYSNTTGADNLFLGYQAGYSNTTGTLNTFLGRWAGRAVTTGNNNLMVGINTGYQSTGSDNTFVGARSTSGSSSCAEAMTTGSKNTILGAYNGNQGGLDIRTANNYIVLSDGDGNPRMYWDGANAVQSGALMVTGANQLYSNGNTATNAGWWLLGTLIFGNQSHEAKISLYGMTSYSAGSAIAGILNILVRLDNGNNYNGTYWAEGQIGITTGTGIVINQSTGQVYANLGNYNQLSIDCVATFGSTWTPSLTYYGASAPTGASVVTIFPGYAINTNNSAANFNQYGIGLNATPSSGTGITFPATQSASSNANTLDDYEQGTFTLTATPDGGTITLENATAYYVKIGRVVHITGTVDVSAISSPSGNVYFTAPFTCRSEKSVGSICPQGGFNSFSGYIPVVRIQNGQSFFYIQQASVSDGALNASAGLFTATTKFEFTMTYFTDD